MNRYAALFAVTTLAAGSVTLAEPFNPKGIAADAKWVVHVDVDALVKSPFWEFVENKISGDAGAAGKVAELEIFTGMTLPEDLHSVTVYGAGFDESDGVILVTAKANQQQLLSALQMSPHYASYTHGASEIVSWEDKGKTMYGSFYSAEQVIIAHSRDNVALAIDTLSGKVAGIAADSPLALAGQMPILAGAASNDVREMAQRDKKNPVLKMVQSGSITVAQEGENIHARGSFGVGDEKKAGQLKAIAEGLRAAGIMMAGNDDADANLKKIAPLLPGAAVSSKGSDVLIDWTVPYEEVKVLLQQMIAEKEKKAAKR